MNDHLELLDIIIKLGGHASTKAIVEEYCEEYHMISMPTYNNVVRSTLKNAIQVYYDQENDEWKLTKTPQYSYYSRLRDSGLDNPGNWHGKNVRAMLLDMLSPLAEGTEYRLIENHTDTSANIIELRQYDNPRIMGFWGKKDQTIRAFLNMDLYNSLRNQIELPENELPKKTQAHITISLSTLWNVICIVTGKTNHMESIAEESQNE